MKKNKTSNNKRKKIPPVNQRELALKKLSDEAKRQPGIKEAMIIARGAINACPYLPVPEVIATFSDRTI